MPVTWWKRMRARLKTLAISGTGQALQWASHSPVMRGAVGQFVEGRVVNGGGGLEIEDDDGHARPLHHRQDGGGEGVSGDVKENQVHVRLAETVAGFEGLGRGVNQAEIDDFHAGAAQMLVHLLEITFQARLQAFELRPIGVQTNAEQSDASLVIHTHL